MPVNDAFLHLLARFYSQDWYLASQNLTKIYQKCIRPRVRAVLTEQIFSSPKALPAGHTGSISKGRDKGIGKICTSKPTWFGSRAAKRRATACGRISRERHNLFVDPLARRSSKRSAAFCEFDSQTPAPGCLVAQDDTLERLRSVKNPSKNAVENCKQSVNKR